MKDDNPTDSKAELIVIKFVNNSFKYFPDILRNIEVNKGKATTPRIRIYKIILSMNLTYQLMQILVF